MTKREATRNPPARKRARCWVLALVGGWCATVWADTPLTWTECVRMAERHNPILAAARAQVEASEAAANATRSARLPQLSASGSAAHADRSGQPQGADVTYGASVGIAQSLYSGGKNQADARAADADRERTAATADGRAVALTYALKTAFLRALYAQEQVALLEAIQRRRGDNTELVSLRYDGGREHKGSLALSQATLYEAEVAARQARRQAAAERDILAQTIGGPPTAAARGVTGTLATGPVPESAGTAETAGPITPDILASEAALRAARAQADAARAGFRPDLSVTGSGGVNGADGDDPEREWTVGLRLTYPFWSGGRATHTVRQSLARLREAEANLADNRAGVARTVAEAWRAFADAVETVEVQNRYVAAADVRADIARQQYQAGWLSFENWDLIEDDLIAKRKRLLDARRAAAQAEAGWRKAIGYNTFASIVAGEPAADTKEDTP